MNFLAKPIGVVRQIAHLTTVYKPLKLHFDYLFPCLFVALMPPPSLLYPTVTSCHLNNDRNLEGKNIVILSIHLLYW